MTSVIDTRLPADAARRFLAEEIRVAGNIRSPHLIAAIAETPRERFLPPGPWLIRGVADPAGPRQTDDDDPRHVYHDVAIAVDPARNLYNGQPSLIARWLDDLALVPGERALHIGCGTGYFTALMARTVGPRGHVHAIDIDAGLAERAAANLADLPWVDVRCGNAAADLPVGVDVIVANAGATHIPDVWLDALAPQGRLLVPLTMWVPGMAATIGKGFAMIVTRDADDWNARAHSMVAIYSLQDLRSEPAGVALGQALASGGLMKVTRLRRDPHEPASTCIVHGDATCLS